MTLAEALPIAVIKRFINWFDEFGIPIGGVIVNKLVSKDEIGDCAQEFVLNRVKMQEEYLKDIYSSFSNIRAQVPYLNREVQGVEMLSLMSEKLFANPL